MKNIVSLFVTILFVQLSFSQSLDQATKNKIKAKYYSAEEFYKNGEYYDALDQIEQAEDLFKGAENPSVQNLKVKTLISLKRYSTAKVELDALYTMNPSNDIMKDVATYQYKIDDGIKAEAARKERERLDKIRREEEARLDKIRREEEERIAAENAKIAEEKRKEAVRLAEEEARLTEIKKRDDILKKRKEFYQNFISDRAINLNYNYYDLMKVSESKLLPYGYDHPQLKGLYWAGYIDEAGEMKFNLSKMYKNISFFLRPMPFSEGLARISMVPKGSGGSHIVYIDLEGVIKINNPEYLWGGYFQEGLAICAIKKSKNGYGGVNLIYGFINKNGKKVIPFKYNNYCGYSPKQLAIDVDGNKFAFNGLGGFHYGRASVIKGCKFGIIDKQGKVIVPFQYDFISHFKDGKAYAIKKLKIDNWEIQKHSVVLVLNTNGEIIKEMQIPVYMKSIY